MLPSHPDYFLSSRKSEKSEIWKLEEILIQCKREALWPDWAIYSTLDHFLKALATINLPKSLTFLGNFCEGVKIYHFSIEIIFGQLL